MNNCFCNEFDHPPRLVIPAGLIDIPRQIAGFAEFRRAMLAAIRRHPALRGWRARGDDDFGVMLLEMWAYVADVQAFYDEVLAKEAYLRTAQQRPSLRKLVDLLGYVPKPAVAASVSLAVLAEGRKSILLPKGLAFRSSAFDDEAPQVFELDVETTTHPLNGQWDLAAPPQDTLSSTGSASTQSFSQLLLTTDTTLKKDDLVLVQVGGADTQTQVSTVTTVADTVAEDGKKYKQAEFSPALSLAGNTNPAEVQISKSSQTGSLWKAEHVSDDPYSISGSTITLDGLYRSIKAGQYVILGQEGLYRWFKVNEIKEPMMTLSEADTVTTTNADGESVSVAVPPVTVPATQLVLDAAVNSSSHRQAGDNVDWTTDDASKITLYYGFVSGGTVTTSAKTTVAGDDALVASGPIEQPGDGPTPGRFLVYDKNENGYEVSGSLDYSTGELTLGQEPGWITPLAMPVKLYGNVVTASRGESVTDEILGSGDASLANQFFVLKKSPLTYTSSPTADNEQGVASSLKVYVNGILWREVPSFYGVGPEEQVYLVRQNDERESIVTFGDGQRGARLPTGMDNIVATYRHGAGQAAPPAGAITQLAKPVKGLTSVFNPVAATGGDEAETSENLRDYAPQSALLLGRAVSIQDMQAVAAGVPGVRAVNTEWYWNETKQRPVIQVWYIGDENIKTDVGQALRRLADPGTPIAVEVAQPVPLTLLLDVEIDERYLEDDVLPQVRAALMDSRSGLLAPERIGIGAPLFRSRVFEVVMSVELHFVHFNPG
jgi:hypothetical protein